MLLFFVGILFSLTFFNTNLIAQTTPLQPGDTLIVSVVEVRTGNELVISYQDQQQVIKLACVGVPPPMDRKGLLSRTTLVNGTIVNPPSYPVWLIYEKTVDNYWLVWLYSGSTNWNRELISNGYAFVDHATCPEEKNFYLEVLEVNARRYRQGIWGE